MGSLYRARFWLVAFALLCLLPLVTDQYIQYIVNLILAYIVIAIGLNLVMGYAGLFVFAHAAFVGIGAYTAVLLVTHWQVNFLLALPLAGVTAGLLGCVVGIPAIRVSGLYLAMVTLAFAQLVQWIMIQWIPLTKGLDGISLPPTRLFDWTIRSDASVFYVCLIVAFGMIFAALALLQGRLGRAFLAVRESEIVARCNGVNVAWTKAAAVGLSAAYAGIGGALLALVTHYVHPSSFGLAQTIMHFCVIVVGGLGSLAGSIIGAILLTSLPEVLRETQYLQEIAYGLLLIAFVVFAPGGIAGLLRSRGLLPREILARHWRDLALARAGSK